VRGAKGPQEKGRAGTSRAVRTKVKSQKRGKGDRMVTTNLRESGKRVNAFILPCEL